MCVRIYILVYVSIYFVLSYKCYNKNRISFCFLNRYIELTTSTYNEAKKTITNDAYLNGKRFAGERDDEDNKNKTNNEKTKRRSRSISRDRYIRPINRHRSLSKSPRSRSRRK
jgi:hypothetical protein